MDNNLDFIAEIKKNRNYRGQIHKGIRIEGNSAIPFDIDNLSDNRARFAAQEILDLCGFPFLYSHQGILIEHLLADETVGLFLPQGSGRRSAVMLDSAVYAIVKGKAVLVLCRDDEAAKKLEARFPRPLSRLIQVHLHDQEHFAVEMTTDIIISTPERMAGLLLQDYAKIERWLSILGLLVVSDLTRFDSAQRAHTAALVNLFSSMIADSRRVAYLVTGEPINNAVQVVGEISKIRETEKITAILVDGRGKNALDLLYWIPSYIINLNESSGRAIVERRDFYQEIGSLLEIMKERKKILVWHAFAVVSKDRIARLLKSFGTFTDITVIKDLDDIEAIPNGGYDGMIMLGLPENIRGVIDALGHYLVEGSPVAVVLPNDPVTMHFIRIEDSFLKREYPELLMGGATPYLEFLYYLIYLYLTEQIRIEKADLTTAKRDGAEYFKNHLIEDKIIVEEENHYRIDRSALIDRLHKHFHETSQEEVVKVKIGQEERALDLCYFPERYYPGSFYFSGDTMRQLVKDDGKYEFRSCGELAPVKRTPMVQYAQETSLVASSSHSGLKYDLLAGKLNAAWNGYKEYAEYSEVPRNPIITKVGEGLSFQRETMLIRIECAPVSHEIYHLLKIWLSRYYLNFDDYYDLFSDETSVYLFSYLSIRKDVLNLFGLIPSIVRKAFEDSLGLLLDACPCSEGCPYCLEVGDCPRELEKLNKKRTIEFIAKITRLNAEKKTKFKYEGLGFGESQSFYEGISRKIFEVFEKKLDLPIKSKVPIIAVKMGVLTVPIVGLFTGNLIQVNGNLPEAVATEVIAHEYAHNWAAENMVVDLASTPEITNNEELRSILRKLIVEGFAQWVAFKIMDYYGLESSMSGIYLWGFDEYGEGFRVLYWLEEKLGFQAVLDFVKTGNVAAGEGQIWKLNDILDRSGFKSRVLSWVKNQ